MMLGFPPWPLSGISRRQEIGLGNTASRGVSAARNDEKVVHLAVVRTVGIPLKAGLTNGTIRRDEPGHVVLCPVERGDWRSRGYCAGLDPPGAGCEWQDRHWLELKRGPSPLLLPPATTSISANRVNPSWKNVVSSAVRSFKGPPAPGAPPRTPGSTGPFAGPPSTRTPGMIKIAATKATRIFTAVFRRVFMPLSFPDWIFKLWVYVELGLDFDFMG